MTIDTSTEAVERLLDDLSSGPWGCMDYTSEAPSNAGWYIVPPDAVGTIAKVNPHFDHDAYFIAAARELVPALLKERDEARARIDALEAFIADFASAKFDSLPQPYIRHPADEPDPVTEAVFVWSWQEDAKELLKGEKK